MSSTLLRGLHGRGVLWWMTTVLGAVVVGLIVYLLVLIPTGTSAIPAQSVGDQRESDTLALRAAVTKELTTFYTIDYKKMDPLIAAVSDGSTGPFHDKYSGLSVTLKAGASQLKVTARATVAKLGVHQIKGDTATILAVVNQVISNTQTRGKTKATATCAAGSECNYFHLWVTYSRVGGRWKMSNLEYLR